MRYFFHIAFYGSRYRGWQKFPDINSVQYSIEDALTRVFKTSLGIVGCGRTDAGVHASQFFFHVDLNRDFDFDLRFRLNQNLPEDISIFDIFPVEQTAHARFDATSRTYDYFIHTYKDPFLNGFSSYYPYKDMDIEKMKRAVSLLRLYNDYRGFCKTPAKYKTTICHVANASLYSDSTGSRLRFTITANRFLSGMIRVLISNLIAIGRGELSLETFESYLIEKQPASNIERGFPQGLYLSAVEYPYFTIPPRTDFVKMLDPGIGRWQIIK